MSTAQIVFVAVYFGLAVYAFQVYKRILYNPLTRVLYFFTVFSAWVFWMLQQRQYIDGVKPLNYDLSLGVLGSFFVLVFIASFFSLIDDIYRLFLLLRNWFLNRKVNPTPYYPERRRFLAGVAIATSFAPFSAMMLGLKKSSKYNFKVHNYDLEFSDLPKAFDQFKIAHISDFHAGSFDDPAEVERGLQLVQELQADAVLFTGDMVNNLSDEAEQYIDMFSKVSAKYGKFSVLGNHDYGDYYPHDTDDLQQQDVDQLIDFQSRMGFKVLLDETVTFEKEQQKIHLIGVQNWGTGRFPKKGDLQKASAQTGDHDFKILMSHDPSHWEAEVLKDQKKFQLTLSGHTHGFQIGIEIPGLKWSPIQYRYKQWAGLYSSDEEHLIVNRGFGHLGYPGRYGIWPEIGLITLKSKLS
jgi:predicted MPP superfamily phosphohydrolase